MIYLICKRCKILSLWPLQHMPMHLSFIGSFTTYKGRGILVVAPHICYNFTNTAISNEVNDSHDNKISIITSYHINLHVCLGQSRTDPITDSAWLVMGGGHYGPEWRNISKFGISIWVCFWEWSSQNCRKNARYLPTKYVFKINLWAKFDFLNRISLMDDILIFNVKLAARLDL